MQFFGKGRSCLLRALKVRNKNLFNVGVGKRIGKAFRAAASRVAEGGVCIVGNFIGVTHEKNGAHVLSVRTMS
jgi:hypothetical protein